MVAWMIDTYGTDAQRHAWLPEAHRDDRLRQLLPHRAGRRLGCRGASRPAPSATATTTCSPESSSSSRAPARHPSTSSWRAPASRARAGSPPSSCPAMHPGLSFGANEKKMGWNAQPTRQVILDEVRVPASAHARRAGPGLQDRDVGPQRRPREHRRVLDRRGAVRARPGAELRARALHVRRAARREAGRRLHARRHGDRAARGAGARARCRRSRSTRRLRMPRCECAMAKRFATDAGFRIANEALQLHGGYGYLHEYGIEKVVRDLRVHQILEGTNEIMRVIIGRELLGELRDERSLPRPRPHGPADGEEPRRRRARRRRLRRLPRRGRGGARGRARRGAESGTDAVRRRPDRASSSRCSRAARR